MGGSRDIPVLKTTYRIQQPISTVPGHTREAGVSWVEISTSADFDRNAFVGWFRSSDELRRPRTGLKVGFRLIESFESPI